MSLFRNPFLIQDYHSLGYKDGPPALNMAMQLVKTLLVCLRSGDFQRPGWFHAVARPPHAVRSSAGEGSLGQRGLEGNAQSLRVQGPR